MASYETTFKQNKGKRWYSPWQTLYKMRGAKSSESSTANSEANHRKINLFLGR